MSTQRVPSVVVKLLLDHKMHTFMIPELFSMPHKPARDIVLPALVLSSS